MNTKSYRLSEETQGMINWLAKRKGISATDVIREAVSEMYHREIDKLPSFRLKNNVIYINGKPAIYCSDKLITELPETLILQLEEGNADPIDTMLYLILTVNLIGEPLQYDEETLEETIGWSPNIHKTDDTEGDGERL